MVSGIVNSSKTRGDQSQHKSNLLRKMSRHSFQWVTNTSAMRITPLHGWPLTFTKLAK